MWTIAAFTKNRTNPAYVGARAGIDRVLSALGARAVHYVPDIPDDIVQQSDLIRDALDERPDAILLAPAHATRMAPVIDEIAAAGVPLFCFVSKPENAAVRTFVGADDTALGAAMAERLATHLSGSGRVAIVNGHPDAATTAPRHAGFHRALAAFPGIEIAAEFSGDYQRDAAFAAFAEAIKEFGAVDGVLAANDFMALGVHDALTEAEQTAVIVGANATPDGIRMIKAGHMLASAAFDAMSMAALAAEAAVRHLRGEAVPTELTLTAELVDAENLAAWDRDFDARPTVAWNAATT